ncbi:MAG: 50S ribosomal protein L31e [Methanosarcinaceae archaeon]|nr:50S ribosomal protein L31e [Methanosarcinaceae archaeon]
MAENIHKEQIFTIPLRDVKLAPRWKRTTRAMRLIKKYLVRHTKVDISNIKIDKTINEKIWERGSENPPRNIRVRIMKFEDGNLEAELASN